MNHNLPRRRILGAVFLVSAIGMLILDGTLLKSRLDPLATLLYWTTCVLLTCGAIVCALVDALRSIGQSRREQRALLEDTLHEIEAERARQSKQGGGGAVKSR